MGFSCRQGEMEQQTRWRRTVVLPVLLALQLFAGCVGSSLAAADPVKLRHARHPVATPAVDPLLLVNRLSWGLNATVAEEVRTLGSERYLQQQLHPDVAQPMPAAIQAQIDAMAISQRPLTSLAEDMEQQRKTADAISDDGDKQAAKKAYHQALDQFAREAAQRSLLRDVYSPNQLLEQMTWFWMNHFSIFQGKSDLRVMVGDYEEHAVRPYALGRFRDLLAATVHHPAMLRYLDNQQNALGHINENYARELMELHTLGVDGGYSQQDVQELARILTGFGVVIGDRVPRLRPEFQAQYDRNGLFEFNPARHDYGDKVFLGKTIAGQGQAELDQALDLLASSPATARFISRQLALYFTGEEPEPALLARMSDTFLHSDGQIADTLAVLLHSRQFNASLGKQFKDPVHYVVSAVRLAYDDKPILNARPMMNWLNRMGEPLYGRQTPDGYALDPASWSSSGQMTTRFEVAKAIGNGSAGLFKTDDPQPIERPAFPQLANALFYQSLQARLGDATRAALAQAGSPQEWNMFLLSAPEFMLR